MSPVTSILAYTLKQSSMTATQLKGKRVTNQYGETVTVISITDNSVQVLEENISYHTTKLFYQGKSLYNHLNS